MTISLQLRGDLTHATSVRCGELAEAGFIESLAQGDPTLWGEHAQAEASIRLGWTLPPSRWMDMAHQVSSLRLELSEEGITRVILCGMGGSSLGPEVMVASAQCAVTVIDSTHPDEIASVLADDLSDAVVVVSSKSGGTVETDSQKRAFEAALASQGLDPARHLVVVTDPGSPLHESSLEAGYRVFEGDPTIGGRFSAVSPFGLVPAGLAGMDLIQLLGDAMAGYDQCTQGGPDNPALVLGVAISQRHPEVNKLLYRADQSLPGFGDWVEQLIAESTGKDGKGILPVVESSLRQLPDALSVGPEGSGSDITLAGSLAEQMVLWEFATAVACAELGVNPFDQPNVESAKVAARELLESHSVASRTEEDLEGLSVFSRAPGSTPQTLEGIPEFLESLLSSHGYLAVCVFAPRRSVETWREMGWALEEKTGRPVTIGFGPRFLHSTGQLHKGGAPEGVFVQVIQTTDQDVAIPGRDFGFWQLMISQAHGDAQVLEASGQPVMSLTGNVRDIARLQAALGA